jgi:hypothetical protein
LCFLPCPGAGGWIARAFDGIGGAAAVNADGVNSGFNFRLAWDGRAAV